MEHPNHLTAAGPAADFAEGAAVAVLTAEGLDRLLDYRAPEGGVSVGEFVEAPLGPRRVLGVVWGPGEGGYAPEKLRPIGRVLDAGELEDVLAFVREEVASSKLKRGIDIAVTVLCVLVVVVWIVRLINPADAGLLFGGYAPAGVPDDIIHLEPPRWLTILRSYLA